MYAYAYPYMQNTQEIIANYAVDANLFRLESTNPKKISSIWMVLGGEAAPPKKNENFLFKSVQI